MTLTKTHLWFIVVALIATLIGVSIGVSYHSGQNAVRREAVDNNAAQYRLADQYGTVTFEWRKQQMAQR